MIKFSAQLALRAQVLLSGSKLANKLTCASEPPSCLEAKPIASEAAPHTTTETFVICCHCIIQNFTYFWLIFLYMYNYAVFLCALSLLNQKSFVTVICHNFTETTTLSKDMYACTCQRLILPVSFMKNVRLMSLMCRVDDASTSCHTNAVMAFWADDIELEASQ